MNRHVFLVLMAIFAIGIGQTEWLAVNGAPGVPAVKILEQSSRSTTFEVTVPGLELERVAVDGQEFVRLNLPGEVMAVLDEGKPQVPKVSVLLGIPLGARISARVLSKETERFKVDRIYPLQPPLLDNQEPGPLVIDHDFYAQDVSYPGKDWALINTGVWRDLGVANLQVYPVQVNPAKGEIEVTKRILVRVDYSGGNYPEFIADWMVPLYSRYVDNFNFLPVKPLTDYTPGVRYLVFCNAKFDTCVYLNDSLLSWVHQRGYQVRKITKASFTAQEIKDSIRAEYNRNNPALLRWVLLVGEYGDIPMGSYSGVGRSDFWYSDILPWPSGDNYPEIGIARLSVKNPVDLSQQISKILKYQKNPPSTNNWLDKLSMPAHSEQYPGKYSGCVRGIYFMPKPYWNPSVVETIMGYYTGNTTVTNAINEGRGIVAYRGHGDYMEWWEWGTEGSWYNSHVNALTNGDLTPVVYNIACNCGDIYQDTCLSEKWMNKYPGGAVASLAATQASYTLPNHGICSTLVRATCDTWTITVPGVRDYGPTVFNLADIKCYGVDAYVAKYWPGSPYPYNIWMYVMLGDPSMPVWAGGMPQSPSVTLPDSIPLGPYNLNVTVRVGSRPVVGALVCAYKEPDIYVSERTDAAGVAVLALNASTPGDVRITVSEGHAEHFVPGAQHTPILPYTTTRPVGGGGTPQPYVVYVSNMVIDSPPGGNNNGRFDPGETGKIIVTLRNAGNATAQGVSARLKSSNNLFVITDSTANYGNIPQDSLRNNRSDPFIAQANGSIPPGTVVVCTLKVHSDNYQHDWTYTFALQVGQPPMPGQFMVDLDTGSVLLSVCAIGSIGYDEPATDLGQGFKVPKTAASCLYFGALMAGNSPTYLVDHFYGQPASSGTNHDWRTPDSFRMVTPPAPADEHWLNTLTDGGHSTPKGLQASQHLYMNSEGGYDDWAVLTYEFTNNGSQPINGFYTGIIADFDIGSSPTTNIVVSDTVRRAVLMRQQSSENPSAGLILLEPERYANIGALDHAIYVYPDSCMTDNQKFRVLNGTIVQRNSNRAYDWSVFVSAGPVDLPVGGTWRVAFGVVGATTVNGFWEAADSCQRWYVANLLGVKEEAGEVQVSAAKPLIISPNPFRNGAYINYFTPEKGNLELVVFDAAGRVAEQHSFAVEPGAGRFFYKPGRLANGVYFLKVRAPNSSAVAKFLVVE
ncbi:MAG: C25 family cysteine peptidase [candidate division WOR-3 bacterium]|jgi:hypothetical protein|nr:C25 family cysteine peptidase [candidate division WOR-3 bacterium]MDH7518523.1 C25 family cysteine peptidase [bacterium]